MKKVIIIGGGGHAQSVLEMIGDLSIVEGYVAKNEDKNMPIPFLGVDDYVLNHFSPNLYEIHHAIVYENDVNLEIRKKMILLYANYNEHTFISSKSNISQKSLINPGTSIFPMSIINMAKLGYNNVINNGCIVEHGCCFGNNVVLATGSIACGNVLIDDNTYVGSRSVIRDGIHICNDVVIGMGSVVVKDISTPGLYYGNPAKLIKS